MPKVTLTFQLPEEQSEYETTTKAGKMASAMWEISNEVFRPARKHGYQNSEIQETIQYLDSLAEQAAAAEGKEYAERDATSLIRMLEVMYHDILREYEVSDMG